MCVFDGLARSRRRHHKYQVAASWRESGKPAGIKAGRASQSLYSFFCACSPLAPHSRNAPVTSPDTTHWPFGDIAAQVVFLTWPGKQQMLPFHIDRFRTNLESNLPWHSLASRKCRPAFRFQLPADAKSHCCRCSRGAAHLQHLQLTISFTPQRTSDKSPLLSLEMEQKVPLSVEGSGGMLRKVCAIALLDSARSSML